MIKATLRFATRINSFVPSRIVETDLADFETQHGFVNIKFTYDGKIYEFKVPYTRPYTNKEIGKFANLLNLNQRRGLNNEEFKAFTERITDNFSANPAIEISCEFALAT
jgi:hypothetical protein